MKNVLTLLLAAVLTLSLFTTGCGKGDGGLDTAAIEKAFSSADSGLKASAEKAIASVKAGDFAGALSELQKLASDVKITPEQKTAVSDFIAQVKAKAGEMADKAVKEAGAAANKAGEAATKAADDLKKSVGK